MKKFAFALMILGFCACNSSKKKAETTTGKGSLEQRLDEYMMLTGEMNLEKIMDYIYPKLFTIAPRESVLEAMREGLQSDEVKVELDSLKADKVYPVFTIGEGSYAKIDYSMIMLMDYTIPDETADNENKNVPRKDTGIQHSIGSDKNANSSLQTTMIKGILAEKYGDENVSVDPVTGTIKIRTAQSMVAVKDSYAKEWSFVSLKEEDPMISKLFSKEVLDKLATYK